MDTEALPTSPRLRNLPKEHRAKLLATCYAFYAYSHERYRFIDSQAAVKAHILASFPVWEVNEERQRQRTIYSFERTFNGQPYFFHRTKAEFLAMKFSSIDDRKVERDAAIFAHLNFGNDFESGLLSTSNVSMNLLAQISLALIDDSISFPRILIVQNTGQCGLLVTTNHSHHRTLREHLVFPLPELSFGIRPDLNEQFSSRKMPLANFILSSKYSMSLVQESRGEL